MKFARPAILAALAMMTLETPANRPAMAQEKTQIVRLARLVIDSSRLEAYRAALAEGVKASMTLEPGVLTLYAVAEKNQPNHFTILEIYADSAAYQDHVKSPHFLKYKATTEGMVQSLELIDAVPLVPGMKIK